jgi:EamA domain-containing membrane protein RarD
LSTIIPLSVYTFGLGRLPASIATILAMTETAFVAVYACVLLDERLQAGQMLGAVLVVGGVLLLSCTGGECVTKGERQRTAFALYYFLKCEYNVPARHARRQHKGTDKEQRRTSDAKRKTL